MPPAATTPAANSLRYPILSISGIAILANTAAVATDAPETAANPAVAKIVDDFMKDAKFKENSGFNSDYNEVTIHYKNSKNKKEKLKFKKKSEISEEIVDRISTQIN